MEEAKGLSAEETCELARELIGTLERRYPADDPAARRCFERSLKGLYAVIEPEKQSPRGKVELYLRLADLVGRDVVLKALESRLSRASRFRLKAKLEAAK